MPLDRDRAKVILESYGVDLSGLTWDRMFARLEACVAISPRIAALEALLDRADATVAHKGDGEIQTRDIRAVLRSDEPHRTAQIKLARIEALCAEGEDSVDSETRAYATRLRGILRGDE